MALEKPAVALSPPRAASPDASDSEPPSPDATECIGFICPDLTVPPRTPSPPLVPNCLPTHTPLGRDPNEMIAHEHRVPTIHPYVLEDLRRAQSVELWDWFEITLGLSEHTVQQWAKKIGELGWFEDPVIQRALGEYSNVKEEKERYEPFTTLANRVLELAPGKLRGVPKRNPYPMSDLRYAIHCDRQVEPIPEHGIIAGDRRPDVVVVREERAKLLATADSEDEDDNDAAEKTKKSRARWTDIMLFWELKKVEELGTMLDEERKARGMPRYRPLKVGESGPRGRPRASTSKSKARGSTSNTTKRSSTRVSPVKPARVRKPETKSVKAGMKRRLDDRDPEDVQDGPDRSARAGQREPKNSSACGSEASCQAAAYALELLSCTYGTRLFCLAAVLRDDQIFLWYYGSNGILHTSQPLSLVKDFERAAAILVVLASRTPEQLGALPTSYIQIPPTIASLDAYPLRNLTGAYLDMQHPDTNETVRVTLRGFVFAHYTLTGRRTFVYKASVDRPIGADRVIIKFSYQVSTRRPEPELLAIAHAADVEHLAESHMWKDIVTVEDIAHQAYAHNVKWYSKLEKPKCENRIFRAIVYTEYYPLRTLFCKHFEAIPLMVDQMLDCLHDLRHKAKILHRDLSVNNIMWEVKDGELYFRLIDFDMATVLPETEDGKPGPYRPSSMHRTGTLPFMAPELVWDMWMANSNDVKLRKTRKPIAHLLRHDFVSLFFIALWCGEVLPTQLQEKEDLVHLIERAKSLEKGGLEAIGDLKMKLCSMALSEAGVQLSEAIKPLFKWFKGWDKIFAGVDNAKSAYRAQKADADSDDDLPPWNDENQGGTFTRDTIKAVLTPRIPPQTWTIEELTAVCSDYDVNDDLPGNLPPILLKKKSKRQLVKKKVVTKPERIEPAPEPADLEPSTAVNDIRSRLRPRKPRQ